MTFRIICADVMDGLRQLEDESVHCVVTSPPYWGLRDYGVAGQIGLEPTPDAFVARMVEVFREVRRVLRSDGQLWLNMGDAYAGGHETGRRDSEQGRAINGRAVTLKPAAIAQVTKRSGLKPKDLMGMPWRVAFALQADGWVLRQEIIWHKVNPMPESVTDRCTKSHEQIFMFAKASWSGPAQRQFSSISDEDARWLALFLDTEGNITVKRSQSKETGQTFYGAQICFAGTHRRLIGRAQSIIGRGTVLERAGKNAPMYYLQFSNIQAADLLHRLYPHLIVKGRQARLCIHLQDVLAKAGHERRTKDGRARGRCRSDEYTAELERIWATNKALNHFADPDLGWVPELSFGKWAGCERYYYDNEAVKEAAEYRPLSTWEERRGSEPMRRGDPGQSGHVTRTATLASASGRNKRSVWTIATAPFPEAHFACVDAETECLTATGWKRHGDLRPGMLAAQFDTASGKLSWAPVQDVARYDVADQGMIVGTCRDLDMWLTPNHRTIVQRRHPRTRDLQAPAVIRADELKAAHSVPTAADWAFDGDASVPLEWAELLGWYVAEGHESKDSLTVEMYQSEAANAPKCRRIEDLLRQTGAEWTKATCKRIWRGRNADTTAYRVMGYAAVRLREMAPGKRLPWGAVLWSADRVAALVDGLVGGDGHTRMDGRRVFVQKDKDQCDLFQALAMRLGYSATLSVRPDGVGRVYVTSHRTRSFRGTNGRGSAPTVEKYTGVVWCPKLPNGTWVARRNGRAFITGNTFPPELPELCIKAGTSQHGCCAKCGAPWERETERVDTGKRQKMADGWDTGAGGHGTVHRNGREKGEAGVPVLATVTLNWSPSCSCSADVVPATVLDPFSGAGTTSLVADRLGRDAIGIELNPEYAAMSERRVARDRLERGIQSMEEVAKAGLPLTPLEALMRGDEPG